MLFHTEKRESHQFHSRLASTHGAALSKLRAPQVEGIKRRVVTMKEALTTTLANIAPKSSHPWETKMTTNAVILMTGKLIQSLLNMVRACQTEQTLIILL